MKKIPLAMIALVLLAAVTAVAEPRPIDGPEPPEPFNQSIGFYSAGHLRDANPLADEGDGFVHLFRDRDRGWGTQGLIDLLQSAASRMAELYPDGERLQIGDVAAERGGPISGHASHQIGLDADVVYFRVNHEEQPITYTRGFEETFVRGNKLSSNFDLERNWAFIKILAESGRVQRIFVHPVIKRELCRFAREQNELESRAEALRILRDQSMHYDHMHIRLTCPPTSPHCVRQDDPPPGSGCEGSASAF